jgi:hypothetical protein
LQSDAEQQANNGVNGDWRDVVHDKLDA